MGSDALSFEQALRQALGQDPNKPSEAPTGGGGRRRTSLAALRGTLRMQTRVIRFSSAHSAIAPRRVQSIRRCGRFDPRATEHRERALEREPRGQAHQGTAGR
jgi:hypothetical protein